MISFLDVGSFERVVGPIRLSSPNAAALAWRECQRLAVRNSEEFWVCGRQEGVMRLVLGGWYELGFSGPISL